MTVIPQAARLMTHAIFLPFSFTGSAVVQTRFPSRQQQVKVIVKGETRQVGQPRRRLLLCSKIKLLYKVRLGKWTSLVRRLGSEARLLYKQRQGNWTSLANRLGTELRATQDTLPEDAVTLPEECETCAGDTSDHAIKTHAGANRKNVANGPWKMCRFVFVCFIFCLT